MRNVSDGSKEYQSWLFHQGTNFTSYVFLGAHETKDGSGYVCTFRVWAPFALSVSLISDRTGWDNEIPFARISGTGIWELSVSDNSTFEGTLYKYVIVSNDGKKRGKSDPFEFSGEYGGGKASIVSKLPGDGWHDSGWMSFRKTVFAKSRETGRFYPAPMNIYEIHLGSWMTKEGCGTSDGRHYLNYREIAHSLAPYLLRMGYTHVELLPVMEHPFDGSWGYQITGYYAPTSRFGSPRDFAYFVDFLHCYGIGVILDWVPAHFPKDENGLIEFDGTMLYEYQGADRMEHKGWGTRFFDVGRPEVQSFLISNALFWFREYHIDGLRIDAVASMLYLDYDRGPGEWSPNPDGGNRNYEAIAFFRKLNTAVFAEFSDVLMIAEESTAWPKVTHLVTDGGLGFNFKWNMGFANDMFDYVSLDPVFRSSSHDKLTFPMFYAFSENFILPVSHDEVVHGKGSLIDKMFGTYDDKFSTMRVFFTYLMTMPGKKLTFMGCEYAQFREWDYENQLEWFMTDFPRHREMQRFVADLNRIYLGEPSLWEIDSSWDGFKWVDADDRNENLVIYRRIAMDGESVTVIENFSPLFIRRKKILMDSAGIYLTLINSASFEYGGGESVREKYYTDGQNVIEVDIPPLCGMILKREKEKMKITASDQRKEEVKSVFS